MKLARKGETAAGASYDAGGRGCALACLLPLIARRGQDLMLSLPAMAAGNRRGSLAGRSKSKRIRPVSQVLSLSQHLAGGGGFLDDAIGDFVGNMTDLAEKLNPVTLIENAREVCTLVSSLGRHLCGISTPPQLLARLLQTCAHVRRLDPVSPLSCLPYLISHSLAT